MKEYFLRKRSLKFCFWALSYRIWNLYRLLTLETEKMKPKRVGPKKCIKMFHFISNMLKFEKVDCGHNYLSVRQKTLFVTRLYVKEQLYACRLIRCRVPSRRFLCSWLRLLFLHKKLILHGSQSDFVCWKAIESVIQHQQQRNDKLCLCCHVGFWSLGVQRILGRLHSEEGKLVQFLPGSFRC